MIFKNYIEMREVMDQPGQRFVTATWKSMENLVGTKNLVLYSSYDEASLFRILQKRSFSVQGVWHPANMLPSMVHGQAFRIITCQPSIESAPLSAIQECGGQLCGLESWEPSPSPYLNGICSETII